MVKHSDVLTSYHFDSAMSDINTMHQILLCFFISLDIFYISTGQELSLGYLGKI